MILSLPSNGDKEDSLAPEGKLNTQDEEIKLLRSQLDRALAASKDAVETANAAQARCAQIEALLMNMLVDRGQVHREEMLPDSDNTDGEIELNQRLNH